MKSIKSLWGFIFSICLTFLTLTLGAASGVYMADASNLPDAGKTIAGDTGAAGAATETSGRTNGDDEFYSKEIDQRIVKIRPMATPVDQISRFAKASSSKSFEVKYYSVGTRPISCMTTEDIPQQASGASVSLPVDDANMFTIDDTIRVVGVKGTHDDKGVEYTGSNIPDLVLCVCGRDASTNLPTVYAVNGNMSSGQAIWLPAIPAGTTLVRMGKACGELDVQTGKFNNIPMPEIQYCQNFMIQVEQSTFDKIAEKEVDWSFSDIEEDGIYDMRVTMENSWLWGVRNVIKHVSKENQQIWFTGGIWYMAGKDIEVGTWNATNHVAEITDDDLVDISKDLFVGTGIGNKRKVLLCGSDMLAAFSKIKSDKFRLKESVEVWDLKFKSWETDFGEILTMHHELFDLNGMSDCGFALDPEYLSKKTHLSWSRNILDLKKAGVRNTDAVVLQEVCCLYLRYAKAHARMRLAQPAAASAISLNKSTVTIVKDQSETLVATLTPTDSPSKITWTTSNAAVATVNGLGKVTAKATSGTATITATANGHSATCTVTADDGE